MDFSNEAMKNQTMDTKTKRRSRAEQSPEDRMRRLRNGCCPIHNMPFGQGAWQEDRGTQYFFAKCIRGDCSIGVFCYDTLGGGPWDLPAELSHLISPTFARPNEVVRIEPSLESKQ